MLQKHLLFWVALSGVFNPTTFTVLFFYFFGKIKKSISWAVLKIGTKNFNPSCFCMLTIYTPNPTLISGRVKIWGHFKECRVDTVSFSSFFFDFGLIFQVLWWGSEPKILHKPSNLCSKNGKEWFPRIEKIWPLARSCPLWEGAPLRPKKVPFLKLPLLGQFSSFLSLVFSITPDIL